MAQPGAAHNQQRSNYGGLQKRYNFILDWLRDLFPPRARCALDVLKWPRARSVSRFVGHCGTAALRHCVTASLVCSVAFVLADAAALQPSSSPGIP